MNSNDPTWLHAPRNTLDHNILDFELSFGRCIFLNILFMSNFEQPLLLSNVGIAAYSLRSWDLRDTYEGPCEGVSREVSTE